MNRQTQWDRKKKKNINPHTYRNLVYDKSGISKLWNKDFLVHGVRTTVGLFGRKSKVHT